MLTLVVVVVGLGALYGALVLLCLLGCCQVPSFHSWFRVENRTGRAVWLTPVEVNKLDGKKSVLYQQAVPWPFLPAIHDRDYLVDDGTSVRVDFDYQYAGEVYLAARDESGVCRQETFDRGDLNWHLYRGKTLVLKDWDQMRPADDEVLQLIRAPRPKAGWWVLGASWGCLLVFPWLYRWYSSLPG